MKIVCLDMEGVLTPEIWMHVATRSGTPELNLTTRDVKDYRELMERRVDICRRHGLDLSRIQGYISELTPFEGARALLDWIRDRYQLVILSDTFYEFAGGFMEQLGRPMLFCHSIAYDGEKGGLEFTFRQENSKARAVQALKGLNFRTFAAGDAYNDVHMLKEADVATFFRAPAKVQEEFSRFGNLQTYQELMEFIGSNL